MAEAAEHFLPMGRDPAKRARLEEVLRHLWGGKDAVEVHRCETCGFGFAAPNVAGDRDFYNLISDGDQLYPSERWEFGRTLEELSRLPDVRGELLECGAGSGSFLNSLRSSSVGARLRPMAAEYNESALRRLRKAGFVAEARSITEFGEDDRGRFGVICMFQTLEHIDDAHGVFDAFRRLGSRGAHIFVSVPNAATIDAQERLVGHWDMPPNHVGRWTSSCFERMASQHGLVLVECQLEPVSRVQLTWRLAFFRVLSLADEHTFVGRINGIRSRLVRGPLKRILAGLLFLRLWPAARSAEGGSLWVHLRNPD